MQCLESQCRKLEVIQRLKDLRLKLIIVNNKMVKYKLRNIFHTTPLNRQHLLNAS